MAACSEFDHLLRSYYSRGADELVETPSGEGLRRRGDDDPATRASQRDRLTREMSETDLAAEIVQHPMDVADDPIATILCIARFVPRHEHVERGRLWKGVGA